MKTAKYALLAVSAFAFVAMPRAHAGDQGSEWFWEDQKTYGWSTSVDARHNKPPPQHFDRKLSLAEQCGRLVGRLLLRDRPGHVYSTQLEDACVRNGGRL